MSLHYISDRSLMRSGYAYEESPGGGFIGAPVTTGNPHPKPDEASAKMAGRLSRWVGKINQLFNRS